MKYAGQEMELGQLFKHVMEAKREDIAANGNRVKMYHDEEHGYQFDIADGMYKLPVNEWGRVQMNNRLAAGLNTYSNEIPRDLYLHNVNTLLARSEDKYVFRTLENGDPKHVRAVVSDQYMPIDNHIVLPDVINIFGQYPDRWKAIGGFPTDVRTYVRFVERDPSFIITDAHGTKREYRMGVMWRNSEVGQGYMEFIACVLDGYCQNGVMFSKLVIADCKYMHKGNRITTDLGPIFEERIQGIKLAEIKGMVIEASKIAANGMYKSEIQQIIEESVEKKLTGTNKDKAIEAIFKRGGISKTEGKEIMMHMNGDFSAFGVQAAITEYAQGVESYDRRIQLEEVGGDVVSMNQTTWNSINALSN